MPTLAGTLALLEAHCPPSLVSARAMERVLSLARGLPAELSRCVYLECGPGAPETVDLIIDVDPTGRGILAGDNPAIAIDPPPQARDSWARVQAFARAWSHADGGLRDTVRDAWLEFDLGSTDRRDAPSLFVDFAARVAHRTRRGEARHVIRSIAQHVAFPFSDAVDHMLSRCIDALPPHAMLLYAGFMLARATSDVRLCVMGLSTAELAAYLRTVGWPGDITGVVELTESIAQPAHGGQEQPAIVHLDVGAAVALPLGLEYPLARRPQLAGVIAEQRFLDTLVARGMLTADACAGLGTWPGYERRTMPHEVWPSLLVRRVNHVKVVLRDGRSPSAKVYLCAEHTAQLRRPARSK